MSSDQPRTTTADTGGGGNRGLSFLWEHWRVEGDEDRRAQDNVGVTNGEDMAVNGEQSQ